MSPVLVLPLRSRSTSSSGCPSGSGDVFLGEAGSASDSSTSAENPRGLAPSSEAILTASRKKGRQTDLDPGQPCSIGMRLDCSRMHARAPPRTREKKVRGRIPPGNLDALMLLPGLEISNWYYSAVMRWLTWAQQECTLKSLEVWQSSVFSLSSSLTISFQKATKAETNSYYNGLTTVVHIRTISTCWLLI